MDSEFGLINLMVFFFGTVLAGALIYTVYCLVKGQRHGGTVVGFSVPALFVALGFFCISTPKINTLILKYGENSLQMSKLEKKIQESQSKLAEMNQELGTRSAASAGRVDIGAAIAAAKNSSKGYSSGKDWIAMASPMAASVLGSSAARDKYLIVPKADSESLPEKALTYDPKTGNIESHVLSEEEKKRLDATVKSFK